jgi:NAD(P)-dependent dehydrogenase (short-subunit alcohol dehydrogenase family)
MFKYYHFGLMMPFAAVYQGSLNLIFLFTGRLLRPAIAMQPEKLYKEIATTSIVTSEKVCIITGSNTGIGFQTASELVATKAYDVVILACRSKEKGEEAAREIGGGAVFMQCDLGSFESVRSFAAAFNSKYKTLDCLVNNAGINFTGEMALIFKTNFTSHFLLTNLLLPRIRACDGIVVNLASVMHHFAEAHLTVQDWEKCIAGESANSYCDSKFAAVLFTIVLRNHSGGAVRSMAVNPGAVFSDIWRSWPAFLQAIIKEQYLDTKQGSKTTLAAISGEFGDKVYLSPYLALPLFGVMSDFFGIFVGHTTAMKPSLPANPEKNAAAMCEACAKECEL